VFVSSTRMGDSVDIELGAPPHLRDGIEHHDDLDGDDVTAALPPHARVPATVAPSLVFTNVGCSINKVKLAFPTLLKRKEITIIKGCSGVVNVRVSLSLSLSCTPCLRD